VVLGVRPPARRGVRSVVRMRGAARAGWRGVRSVVRRRGAVMSGAVMSGAVMQQGGGAGEQWRGAGHFEKLPLIFRPAD
jgi:hypothetical protein